MEKKFAKHFASVAAICLVLVGCAKTAQPQAPGSAAPTSSVTWMGSPSPSSTATTAGAAITAYEQEFLDKHPWMKEDQQTHIEEARRYCEHALSASPAEILGWTQNDNGSLVISILTTACAERDNYRTLLKDVKPGDADMPSSDEPVKSSPTASPSR